MEYILGLSPRFSLPLNALLTSPRSFPPSGPTLQRLLQSIPTLRSAPPPHPLQLPILLLPSDLPHPLPDLRALQ